MELILNLLKSHSNSLKSHKKALIIDLISIELNEINFKMIKFNVIDFKFIKKL